MLHPEKAWFRALSAALSALTLVFLCGGPWSEASAAARTAHQQRVEAAARAHLDVKQLEDPDGWLADRRAAAAEQRRLALLRMRQDTHADEQEAKATRARAEAEQVKRAEPDVELRRLLAKARSQRTSPEQVKALAVAKAPKLAGAISRNAERARVAATKPPPSGLKGPSRIDLPARPPRVGGARGGLDPAVDELYAQVGGGPALSLATVRAGAAAARMTPRPAVRVASLFTDVGLGAWAVESSLGTLPAPTADDLAQSPETRRSPELVAMVDSLGGTPLALYNFVHTQVASELYYGSKKGAPETLAERAGNDFDQANLLVAMLRAANVPARYEYGTVRLTLAQATALTGGADARTAAFLLAKSGVPAGVGADGKTVLVERAWVRAYVPYGNYRGTGPGGSFLWVRLDPGLKLVKRTQAVNLRGLVGFDFDAYLGAQTQQTPREVFEAQLLARARSLNLCRSLDDVLSKATVVERAYELLPAEHPATVESSLMVFARAPEAFRWTVDVRVEAETQRVELPDLQGRRVALEYPGETPADQAAIDAAGSIVGVIPYQVRVAPSLRVDGVEVKRYAALNPGLSENVTVQVNVPGSAAQAATHRVIAGAPHALVVSAGTTPPARADAERKAVQAATGDARYEALGALALALYAGEQEGDSVRLFALQGHTFVKDVLEGMAGRDLRVTEVGGTPVQLTWGPYVIDIARDSLTPVPRDTDTSQVASLLKLSGYQGSALEHKVWEQALGSKSVSTMNILQAAAAQLVPVYRLTQGSPDRSRLTGFSTATLNDVDNALGAGQRVTIPQRPVDVDGGYVNQEAYILESLVTGAAAYRINTLLNGGANNGGPGDNPEDTNPSSCESCQTANSTVDLATGTMRERWSDLSLPGAGLPVAWARTYSSRASAATELGYGWMSTFGMYLRTDGTNITYVTNDWRAVHFTRSGSSWVCAPGWHLTLTDLQDGRRLRTKNGLVFEFNTSGRLRSIADPSGNQLNISYANGRISQVTDSNGVTALTFTYDGDHISAVTDRANRRVSYEYDGDDLVQSTDVLAYPTVYRYDAAHHLIERVDPRRQTWLAFYDANDRWVGFRDPLGHEASAYYDRVNRRATYVDRTGAAWTREHNDTGNPTALIDPLGNREERTWDAALNLRQAKDSRGLTTVMTYDDRGNMLTRADPDTRSASFTYNASYNQLLTAFETGLPPITNTYDTAGRLKTHQDGLGTTTYNYTLRGQLWSTIQPGNATTTLGYDPAGDLQTITDPTNRVTTLEFDPAGHLRTVTDGNQRTRTLEVDDAGRIRAEIDALQHRTELTYDEAGNRLTTKDPANRVTAFGYDAVGRLTSVTDALGAVQRSEYDGEGRVTASVDPRGFRTTYRYDAAGRMVETTTPDGAVTTMGYCGSVGGSPCQVVDAEGGVTTRDLDPMGRVTRTVDPLGRATLQTYDTGGRLSTLGGPGVPTLTYSYAASGLVDRVQTGSAASTLLVQYEYDGRGNRKKATVGSNEVTEYTYDLANRLLTEKNPLGRTTTYTYDDAGNRRTKLDPNNHTTTYDYDANRRLQVVTFADGTQYTYDYDSRGNRTLERGPSHERHLEFDELNRLKHVTDTTLGRSLDYAYDRSGDMTGVSSADFQASYAYDGMRRVKRAASGTAPAITVEYDIMGRRSRVVRDNGVVSTYAHDGAGQVRSIAHVKGGVVLGSFAYEYDPHGNRISKVMQDGTKEAYGYDAMDRLVSVDYGVARSVSYGLSGAGNRISMSETLRPSGGPAQTISSNASFNAFNQLTASTTGGASTSYAYDFNGNLSTRTTGSQQAQYVWDQDNRLRQATVPGVGVVANEYDANGLRTKRVDSNSTARYLLNRDTIFQEVDAAGATVASYLSNPKAADEILGFSTGGVAYYPLTDALGSVTALVNDTGTVVATNSYDVYGGKTTSEGGPRFSFGFTGREHDASFILNRDRARDPVTGAWLQPDRIGLVGGPNQYEYVSGKPTYATDPTGFLTTVDEYAIKEPIAFLALLEDLGVNARAIAIALIALATALGKDCERQPREKPPPSIYYRGMSVEDLHELSMEGMIKSKAMREDLIFAIERLADPDAADRHGVNSSNPPSPFVGVTTDLATARLFANSREYDSTSGSPSGQVAVLGTYRIPIPGVAQEYEWLFPLWIGAYVDIFLIRYPGP